MPAALSQCVTLPDVAYVLVDEVGALSVESGPGRAVVHQDELWEQPALRAHLRARLGAGLDIFGHAPGLVAVVGDQPVLHGRPNRMGRALLEELGACTGTALLRELWGPVALLAVEPGELVTSSLRGGQVEMLRRLHARQIAEATGLCW